MLNLAFVEPCHQTNRTGWTFIDPILFLASSFLYLTYT